MLFYYIEESNKLFRVIEVTSCLRIISLPSVSPLSSDASEYSESSSDSSSDSTSVGWNNDIGIIKTIILKTLTVELNL